LEDEVLELQFNYLDLHNDSWTVLRKVADGLDDTLARVWGDDWMRAEWTLPMVVGYILMDALKSKAESHGLLERSAKLMAAAIRHIEHERRMREINKILMEMKLDRMPDVIIFG
jgi:hypothetical protein